MSFLKDFFEYFYSLKTLQDENDSGSGPEGAEKR